MKPHYPILDGLRGVAAVLVVVSHVLDAHYRTPAQHPVHHGYLAVDFFFLLSGFVVGYAYDDRWGRMSGWDFLKIRLIRLHPLVVLGVLLGAISFVLDPFTNDLAHVGWPKFVAAMLISFTLLPAPDLRGWGETHSLDGPCWSLMQEYLANLLYAFIGHKLGRNALKALVIISAVALAVAATRRPDVSDGWSYGSLWFGVIRMMYPFFAGLLLFRSARLIRIPWAFPVCSLVLVVLFCLPNAKHNGLFEAACIILVFPLVVAAGAGSAIGTGWAKVSKLLGDLSYPLYITHYPLLHIYTAWVFVKKPAPQQFIPVAGAILIVAPLLAYAALKLYDEPARTWLKKQLLLEKA